MAPHEQFDAAFEALTRNLPYPWQRDLFALFVSGVFPPDFNLPTGSGKTAIMAVWLAALAQRKSLGTASAFPRRLIWVVDRRVVVDQASDEARDIRCRLLQTQGPVAGSLREQIGELSISTLRGELEDNQEWSRHPERPAIVVGTVDMIGSRLLFSGYGDGPYRAAQHAGLLGQDTLIVNDEAHLTHAFAQLLRRLEQLQQEMQPHPLQPFHTLRLSATHGAANTWPPSLADDELVPRFHAIFRATKRLQFSEASPLDLACGSDDPSRVLIYLESPEEAARLAEKIEAKANARGRVATLTGTMRGRERDAIAGGAVYQAFASPAKPSERLWLVATSAAEVGANISSDVLITEAAELDHLLQRFGRTNRFGETDSTVSVVPRLASKDSKERKTRFAAARVFLESLPRHADGSFDVSPAVLFGRPLPPEALSETPLLQSLYGWHIENLAQTSLGRHPARPPVSGWLHGKEESAPEAYLAWRNDVPCLAQADPDDIEFLLLRKRRVSASERLRQRADLLREKLDILAAHFPNQPIILLDPGGEASVARLDALPKQIPFCQILLPTGLGRLSNGMLIPEPEREGEHTATDQSPGACWLATESDLGWDLETISGPPAPPTIRSLAPALLRQLARERALRFLMAIPLQGQEEADSPPQSLLYFGDAKPGEAAADDPQPYLLAEHLEDAAHAAATLAQQVGLSTDLAQALATAARYHDLGKEAPPWQSAARNPNPAAPLAKSQGRFDWRLLAGYRHELGSLLRLPHLDLPPETVELILHLIAAHHKAARPCFGPAAADRRDVRASARAAAAVPARYAALQRRFGPWGLAWIEALLRAADAQCSEPRGRPATERAHA